MIALVVVATLALLFAAFIAVRRRQTRVARESLTAPRAAMPSVLVHDLAARPDLDALDETLSSRLSSSRSVFDRVRSLGAGTLTQEQLDTVEEVLLRSDVGLPTTTSIVEHLRRDGAPEGVAAAVRSALRSSLTSASRELSIAVEAGRVPVWLFVGVNGVGKTTTIGKIATRRVAAGSKVVLAAGDTFRAAAAEQLSLWGERSGADVVRANEGADPSSVVHDAVERAFARGADLVLADTAGRRHTSSNLLDELSKVRRVADRAPGQVTETLMVLDATTGQNALAQAREFLAAAQVTGIVLTKLDGTARGGIVVAIEHGLGIPVKLIGIGEGPEDLVVFDPDTFVDALLEA